MTKIFQTLFPIVFLIFCLANIITLHDGHNWGDDFAQYILHAINLVEHKPYTENIALDLWTVVPPGFPLILSALIYWVGVNFKILKLLNVIFCGFTALIAFFLVDKKMKYPWPQIVSIWFLTAPWFFFFKQNVLSDIPFLFFVSLSIWVFLKYEEQAGKDNNSEQIFCVLSILLMGYALLIRWAGISLFFGAILYFSVVRRDWKKSLGFIFGALVASVIGINFSSSPNGHFGHSQFLPKDWLYAAWMNTAYIPKVLLDFVISESYLSKFIGPTVFSIFKILGPIIFLISTVFFMYKLSKRRISFMGCFTFLYFLGIILWPVQQGASRYILPVIIPLTTYILSWAQRLFKKSRIEKLLIGLFMIFIVKNLLVIGVNWKFNDDNLYQKETLEMAKWVIDNIPPSQHYMFYKPRALRLLTNRTGAAFWVYPEDQQHWYRRIKPLNIQYLISDKQLDQVTQYNEVKLPVDNYELTFNKVWENSRYKIFEVK